MCVDACRDMYICIPKYASLALSLSLYIYIHTSVGARAPASPPARGARPLPVARRPLPGGRRYLPVSRPKKKE